MATAAAPALSSTELVVGRYRPLQPLGSGGSGSVWLARDETTGGEVALKIVPRDGKAGPRAEREAAAAARLRHERCLRALGLGRDSRHVYIAYEYVPGRTLRQALREGDLDDGSTIEAAAQVLEGLAHAHAEGIIHRDVKPSNVLVTEEPDVSVRLLDFGLAFMDEEETLTAVGDVPGTLAYISPERLRGEPATAAADVWAVGVLLWEALAGWHPFWTASLLETARRIEGGATSLGAARPDLSKPLVALIDRALSLDPAHRPSAAKLAAGLRHAFRARERTRERQSVDAFQLAARLTPPALAALAAGWTSASFPFYPGGAPALLAAVAFALTAVRPRAGLAFALAVPVLPLGNVSAGLAMLYLATAVGWLALSWRSPAAGLFLLAGPLLAPFSALTLLPLAAQRVAGLVRRGLQVLAAVLLTALVAGLGDTSALVGGPGPRHALGIPGNEHPLAVAGALARALAADSAVILGGLALAAAALLAPHARRLGRSGILGLGAALAAVSVVPVPGFPASALLSAIWTACVILVLAGSPRG